VSKLLRSSCKQFSKNHLESSRIHRLQQGLESGSGPSCCVGRGGQSFDSAGKPPKRTRLPRHRSVFPAPCRAAVRAATYEEASAVNRRKTGRGLSQQASGIAPKIKQVDDAITSERQQSAFEIHPEVCFWAPNQRRPMKHSMKTKEGASKRVALLRRVFPEIEQHLVGRPPGVGADDLLDAAWRLGRRCVGIARSRMRVLAGE
jgi:predicted RNase H-like nuclease